MAGGVEHHPDVGLGLDLGEGGARVEGLSHRNVEVADRDVEVRGRRPLPPLSAAWRAVRCKSSAPAGVELPG